MNADTHTHTDTLVTDELITLPTHRLRPSWVQFYGMCIVYCHCIDGRTVLRAERLLISFHVNLPPTVRPPTQERCHVQQSGVDNMERGIDKGEK